ncbi:MAG: hypoxanthine phosphoribosyltransferase [Planctomycetota bacterium]
MRSDLQRILVDADAIARRVDELARQITDDLDRLDHGGRVTLVPILTGSIIFVADLIRRLPQPMQIHLISVSSYPGTATASRGAKIDAALTNVPADLTDRVVLLIDDILDSGNTFRAVTDELGRRNPLALRTIALLRKQRPEAMGFPIDYVGFDIPDEFVVGYGLDFDGFYRNLPDIGVLRPDVIAAGQADAGEAR